MHTEFKKRFLWLLMIPAALFAAFFLWRAYPQMTPTVLFSREHFDRILIDAGHGGADVGAIASVSGAYESDMNLAVAQRLGRILTEKGCVVEYTRSTPSALADTKEEDMALRSRKIASLTDGCMVSIHMNAFSDAKVWGPQVFYQEDAQESKTLALKIQERLNQLTGGTRRAQTADFMVLRASAQPAVLIECGFITNAAEEEKLLDPDYQENLALAIASVLCP